MINATAKLKVSEKIRECINIFHKKTGFILCEPIVLYDLKGTTAGQAKYKRNQHEAIIRLNPVIFADHYETFLNRTVPHEVAHLLNHYYHISKGKFNIRPHGREWRNIMLLLGVDNVSRCHSYSIRPEEKRKHSHFLYKCSCKQFSLTSIRHNRILKGKRYFCTDCKGNLKFIGQEI